MYVKNTFIDQAERKLQLSKKDRLLLEQGIDIVICDGSNFLLVFLIGILFHAVPETIVYLIVLSSLRGHTGGWHASTETKCHISYLLMYLFTFALKSFNVPLLLSLPMILFCDLYMLYHGPIEHKYNPLTTEERKKNIHCIQVYICVFTLLFVIFSFLNPLLSKMILIAFLYNVVLMELLRKSSNWRYYDHSLCSRR